MKFHSEVPQKKEEFKSYNMQCIMNPGVYIDRHGSYIVVFPPFTSYQDKIYISGDDGRVESIAKDNIARYLKKTSLDVKVVLGMNISDCFGPNGPEVVCFDLGET